MDEVWSKISEWLWALLVPVLWYLKTKGDKEMEQVKSDLRDKADKDELDRQRGNIEKLFEANAEIRKDMNGGFQRITDVIHSAQTQILQELAKKADR
jgi:uncharacterized membrane-anchored protein YhcB (DUF1043 family)